MAFTNISASNQQAIMLLKRGSASSDSSSSTPPLPVDQHTVEPYAQIRAGVFAKYSTPKGKGSGVRERVPEDLRVSGKELGIDERDLLIVATAAQYNLVLVTCDGQAGMLRIIEVARDIASQGVLTQLRVHTIEFPPSAAPAC